MVTSFRAQGQFEYANGLVVERLPMGFAAGRWWAAFVYAVPGWEGAEPPVEWHMMKQGAGVTAPNGGLQWIGGGGSGSEREYEQTSELQDRGARVATVVYFDDDIDVGSESLSLDPSDRTGCFRTRLSDGSLLERLPVGHAHGMWRLRWVRSEVPPTETAAMNEDGDDADIYMPHDRFIRLRTPQGLLAPLGASGDIGGYVQVFGVEVPDVIDRLTVDYVCDDEAVVSSEVLQVGK